MKSKKSSGKTVKVKSRNNKTVMTVAEDTGEVLHETPVGTTSDNPEGSNDSPVFGSGESASIGSIAPVKLHDLSKAQDKSIAKLFSMNEKLNKINNHLLQVGNMGKQTGLTLDSEMHKANVILSEVGLADSLVNEIMSKLGIEE